MAVKLKDANQVARAKALHPLLNVEIVRGKKVIRRHNKFDFLGYLSLRITGAVGSAVEGLNLFLNVQGKILPNGFYLDMPQEKGGNGQYYSDACFGSAETRAVITHKVETTAMVQEWITECAKLPKPGATQEQTSAGSDDESSPYETA